MKKVCVFSLIGLLLLSAPAFAATVNWDNDLTHAAYTVSGDGSTAAKSTFSWNEQPWLYVLLPSYATNDNNLKANTTLLQDKWNFGTRSVVDAPLSTSEGYSATKTVNGDYLNFWVTPSNWTSIRQQGSWEIYDIYYQFKNGANVRQDGSFTGNSGAVNFTVTPEPVSMALFGMGAGALGLTSLRRRRLKK